MCASGCSRHLPAKTQALTRMERCVSGESDSNFLQRPGASCSSGPVSFLLVTPSSLPKMGQAYCFGVAAPAVW